MIIIKGPFETGWPLKVQQEKFNSGQFHDCKSKRCDVTPSEINISLL